VDLSTTQSFRHSQGINWSQKIRVLQYQPDNLVLKKKKTGCPWREEPTNKTTLANLENYAERPQQNQDLMIQNQQRLKFSPLKPTLRELHEYCE